MLHTPEHTSAVATASVRVIAIRWWELSNITRIPLAPNSFNQDHVIDDFSEIQIT
jgi:hypothetical protein